MTNPAATRRSFRSYVVAAALALGVVASLSICVVDALAHTAAPGLKVGASPKACPSHDRAAANASGSSQAPGYTLAPVAGEKSILICRYNGIENPTPYKDPLATAYGLIGHHNVTSSTAVAGFVTALNKVAPRSGVRYSCVADVRADIVAYLRMGDGHAYRYAIDTGGCHSIVSGKVGRAALGAQLIGHLERLAPRAGYGTIAGKLVVCSALEKTCGEQKSATSAADICDPICSGQMKITLRTMSGKTVSSVKVDNRDRFTAHVAAGRYELGAISVPGTGVQPMAATKGTHLWVTVKDGKRSRVTVYVGRAGTKLEKA